MRIGFTTGSCAAAGAKASVFMLLTGKTKNKISIQTPSGIIFNADILEIKKSEKKVSCAVKKDGGDDPDVTSGCLIFCEASFLPAKKNPYVTIKGGKGVGKVTMPGLDQKPGKSAINSVPRKMIEKEVLEVCGVCDYTGGILIEISVPDGEEIAKKTFNPRLGIKGGISILGTSGIVEPMSAQALKDTILVELTQKKALGLSVAIVSPGNYGLDFMKENFNFNLEKSVKCSNFIGDTIDMAASLGFKKMLLCGHIGKLIKISGGIMNTHSKEGDCRMELLCAAAVASGCSLDCAKKILNQVSVEEGLLLVKNEGYLEEVMKYLLEKIMFFLNKKAQEKIKIECIVFGSKLGLLAKTDEALNFLLEGDNLQGDSL